MPVAVWAETVPAKAVPPPISQPLVTEGFMAVQLASALGISSATDETTAESQLGDMGIVPRNGWIADYPVTPDIAAEVRQSVGAAADGKKLALTHDEALKRFDDTVAGFGLTVRAYTGVETTTYEPPVCENYPNPAMVATTYSSEGPPIVTYYCPPPDYYYQYAWVPCPFWWSDFWFPGFFILKDFHRHIRIHDRFVLVTNHFNDVKRQHVFRVDPVDRFRGKTFAGIGIRPSTNVIHTGVPHSPQTIFNAPRSSAPVISTPAGTMRGGGTHGGAMHEGGMRGGGIRGGGAVPTGGGFHGGGGSFPAGGIRS